MGSIDILTAALPNMVRLGFGKKAPLFWLNKITRRCNYQCKFCTVWRTKPYGELSTQDALKLVRDIADLGVVFVCIEGGEPLMREDLHLVLKECKDHGIYTDIVTNGSLLPPRADEVSKQCDCITISLDGIGEAHDELRGVPGAFDRAVKAIGSVKGKTRVFVNSVITKTNYQNVGKIADFATENGIYASFSPVTYFAGAEDLRLTGDEFKSVMARLSELKREGKNIFVSEAYLRHCQTSENLECIAWKAYISTDPLGRVTLPCCVSNEPVYLEGGTLRENYFGKRADAVRVLPSCKECILRQRDAIYSEAAVPLKESFGQVVEFCRMYDRSTALMMEAREG